MTIDPQGWLDWPTRRPGPGSKIYPDRNTMKGMALHSAEGWLPGTLGELDKVDRPASWAFTIDSDGTCYQHYPVMASCWASGNRKANTSLVAVECIGVAPAAITLAQAATCEKLVREIGVHAGWKPSRGEPKTLWEHREVWNWETPNAGATACPSERYAPLYARLAETTPPASALTDVELLLLALYAGKEQVGTHPTIASRLGYARWKATQAAIGEAPSIGEMAAAVGEHTHGGVKR